MGDACGVRDNDATPCRPYGDRITASFKRGNLTTEIFAKPTGIEVNRRRIASRHAWMRLGLTLRKQARSNLVTFENRAVVLRFHKVSKTFSISSSHSHHRVPEFAFLFSSCNRTQRVFFVMFFVFFILYNITNTPFNIFPICSDLKIRSHFFVIFYILLNIFRTFLSLSFQDFPRR